MACIKPDGSLSAAAVDVLTAMGEGLIMPETIAGRVPHPLFKIRSTIRELRIGGLIEKPDDTEHYRITALGKQKLRDAKT